MTKIEKEKLNRFDHLLKTCYGNKDPCRCPIWIYFLAYVLRPCAWLHWANIFELVSFPLGRQACKSLQCYLGSNTRGTKTIIHNFNSFDPPSWMQIMVESSFLSFNQISEDIQHGDLIWNLHPFIHSVRMQTWSNRLLNNMRLLVVSYKEINCAKIIWFVWLKFDIMIYCDDRSASPSFSFF